jgi:hypothetical protein
MPEWLNSLRLRLRALTRRHQLEQDLQDEMAFHLAMREEQQRQAGAPADQARVRARRQFGMLIACQPAASGASRSTSLLVFRIRLIRNFR